MGFTPDDFKDQLTEDELHTITKEEVKNVLRDALKEVSTSRNVKFRMHEGFVEVVTTVEGALTVRAGTLVELRWSGHQGNYMLMEVLEAREGGPQAGRMMYVFVPVETDEIAEYVFAIMEKE